MPKNKPYRLLTLAVLTAFGVAMAGAFLSSQPLAPAATTAAPPLLAAAHANPAEIGSQDTLHAGETLSQLLMRAQLAEGEASALLSELNQFQDPRRLRPGSVISYSRSYVDGAVRRVELRLDADRTLSMQRERDSWKAALEEVPVRPDTVVLTGVVTSSLYAALVNGEGSGVPSDERERVADMLADQVFAWQIDFSRDLRTGDQFRVLYERMVRPDGSARTGRVLAVQFSVNKRDYEAYAFSMPSGEEGYFDSTGESLKRAFLRAPLEFRRISSAFSRGRFHPILKTNRPHNGVDYAAATGTPVRAVGDATVRRAGWSGGYGNLVELSHIRGYSTRYAHLNAIARGVRPGTRVKQGDIIGYVGSTGLATGPHLHYEFHSNGRAVDPNSNAVRQISGEPVPSRYRQQFQALMATQVAALDRRAPGVLLADVGTRSDPANTD